MNSTTLLAVMFIKTFLKRDLRRCDRFNIYWHCCLMLVLQSIPVITSPVCEEVADGINVLSYCPGQRDSFNSFKTNYTQNIIFFYSLRSYFNMTYAKSLILVLTGICHILL